MFRYADCPLLLGLFALVFVPVTGQAQQIDIDALNREVVQLHRQGKYSEATKIAKRALELAEKALGSDHPAVGDSLNNIAAVLLSQGRYAEAEPLYHRALAIWEKALAPDHHKVGTSLNNIANLYREQGRYTKAEPLYKRSLAVREKALGPNHPEVADTLNNIASLYQVQGRYAEAEPLYKRGLVIREKARGPNHPSVAESLNSFALFYQNQGRYAEAESLYKRSLAIWEKTRRPDHPNIAESLNNLAELYRVLRRYTEAEPLFKRSLAIWEKELGPAHPNVGASLNNIALLYHRQGRSAEAEPLYKRSLAIWEKARGPHHPSVAVSLNNLATLYQRQGRHAEAEPLYKHGLVIREKALGPDHPEVAETLNNLATLYHRQGRHAEAEPLHKRSLAIREKAFGPDHPDVFTALNNLAAQYFAQRDWVRATEYYRRGTDVIARRTRLGAQTIGRGLTGRSKSEAAQSSYAFQNFVKSAYRLSWDNENAPVGLAAEMFQVAQWSASSGAAGALAKMAARQATGDTKLAVLVRERQDLVDEWQKRDAARSAAVAQRPSQRNKRNEAANLARLLDIDKRIAEIDKRLAEDFPDYAALASPTPSTVADVQGQLKSNEALVLFLDTTEWQSTPEETFIWVVTKTESRWVRSGIGRKTLRDHVDALRCGLDFDGAWKGPRCFDLLNVIYTEDERWKGRPLPFNLKRAYTLYQELFGKVADLIVGRDLLVVPSGPLTQLPVQVLVTKRPTDTALKRGAFAKASWLAQRHAITVLPSVSSLKALRAHARASKAGQPFVGFGNPLLDGDAASAKVAQLIRGCSQDGLLKTAQFRGKRSAIMPVNHGSRLANLEHLRAQLALPETADELCIVAREVGARTRDVYLGPRATEANIKSLSETGKLASYKVLHFATHGALAGELKGSAEPGLILSPPPTATVEDDGYLSASEVAGLKLDADWVILSACNTAGGETTSAEALSGLAKAFFYAGARSLLVSHWYVDSQATVALITKAFALLRQYPKIGRAKALQLAMLSLQSTGKRTWHPAYWAPFVMVGEGG